MLGSLGVGALATGLSVMGGLGESAMAYKGQKDTNRMNRLIAKENREFQAEEAATARDFSAEQAAKQRSYAAQQAKKSRAFQERMSSSSFQRSMQDLENAGLNPIMAAGPGAGASTPVGATAQGQAASASGSPSGSMPTMQNPASVVPGTTSRAVSTASQFQDVRSKQQEIETYNERVRSRLKNDETYRALSMDQRKKIAEETNLLLDKMNQVQAETEATEFNNVEREVMADFYDSAGPAKIAKELGINPNTVKSIFSGIFGKGKKK